MHAFFLRPRFIVWVERKNKTATKMEMSNILDGIAIVVTDARFLLEDSIQGEQKNLLYGDNP